MVSSSSVTSTMRRGIAFGSSGSILILKPFILAQLPQFEFQKKFSSDRGQRVARFFSERARKHDVVPTFGTCGARFERLLCGGAEWRRRARLYLRHSVRRK